MSVFNILLAMVAFSSMAFAKDLYVPEKGIPSPVRDSDCDFSPACIPAEPVGNKLYFIPNDPEGRTMYMYDAEKNTLEKTFVFEHHACDFKFINDHQFYVREWKFGFYDLKQLGQPINKEIATGTNDECRDEMLAYSSEANKIFYTDGKTNILYTEVGINNPVLLISGKDGFNDYLDTDGTNIYYRDIRSNLVSVNLAKSTSKVVAENVSNLRATLVNPAANALYFAYSELKKCYLGKYDIKSGKLSRLTLDFCLYSLKLTPKNEIVATGYSGEFMILDQQGKVLQKTKEARAISSIDFLADGKMYLVLADGSLRVYRRQQ